MDTLEDLYYGNLLPHEKCAKLDTKEPHETFVLMWFFGCAPGMGANLVVKVHYRLGSRNC